MRTGTLETLNDDNEGRGYTPKEIEEGVSQLEAHANAPEAYVPQNVGQVMSRSIIMSRHRSLASLPTGRIIFHRDIPEFLN